MAGFLAGAGHEVSRAAAAVWDGRWTLRGRGALTACFGVLCAVALASHDAADPSWNASAAGAPTNLLGAFGANLSDAALQSLGLASWAAALPDAERLAREAADAVLASPSPEVGRDGGAKRSPGGVVDAAHALATGSTKTPHPALRATLPTSGEGNAPTPSC